jgi:DNA-binding transcriptional ArsR family regulator
MDRETVEEIHRLHARLCQAIADPKRLLLISELRAGAMSVGDLAASLGISQSNCSLQYSLRGTKVLAAIDLLREFMSEEMSNQAEIGLIARSG